MPRDLNAKQQAQAASRRPDVCRIFANLLGNQAEVRSYKPGSAPFAALTREFPGPFGLWDFIPTDEDRVFLIKNMGLNMFIVSDGDNLVVAPGGRPTEFRVQPDGDDFVQIKLKDEDKVWTLRVSGEGLSQEIFLRGAQGLPEQKFRQVVVDE